MRLRQLAPLLTLPVLALGIWGAARLSEEAATDSPVQVPVAGPVELRLAARAGGGWECLVDGRTFSDVDALSAYVAAEHVGADAVLLGGADVERLEVIALVQGLIGAGLAKVDWRRTDAGSPR